MGQEPENNQPQAGNDNQPVAATPAPSAQPPAGSAAPGSATDTDELARLKREIQELRKENAGHRTAKKTAEEAAKKSEEQRLIDQQEWQKLAEARAAELAQLQLQLAATQSAAWRQQAGAKHQLPAELIERLQGANLEELESDAAKLARIFRMAQAPQLDGGASGDKDAPKISLAEVQERAARLGVDPKLLAAQYGLKI